MVLISHNRYLLALLPVDIGHREKIVDAVSLISLVCVLAWWKAGKNTKLYTVRYIQDSEQLQYYNYAKSEFFKRVLDVIS